MTPEQLARAGTEHAHQCALMCWCALNFETYPELKLLFAIPNGGERNPVVASRLKAEGVKSGVPDLFLPVARHGYHGLFIEMKKPKGTIAENQTKWHIDLQEQGYGVSVCFGWESARHHLVEWLKE
jgi:hypothetical protein